MITLAAFESNISRELRRGTSFDDLIPTKLNQALRWMEDQHTFFYMENFSTFTLNGTSNPVRNIAQPSGFKQMEFWRINITASSTNPQYYHYLTMVSARDVSRTETEIPKAYWQSAKTEFWLDNTPDKDYSAEWSYFAYTTLPTDTSQSPAVIQAFEGLLTHQVCYLFGPTLRDEDFMTMHKAARDEAMKAVIDADVEARQANQQLSMKYGWEYVEDVNRGSNDPSGLS